MKLSSALFFGSLITLSMTVLIVFAGNPASPIWEQSIFTGLFTSVFCCAMGAVIDANGH